MTRHTTQLAILALFTGVLACKPQPPEADHRPMPTPMADPNWRAEPTPQPLDGPGGSTATQLPLPTTPSEPAESVDNLLKHLVLRPIDSLSVQLDLPGACSEVASGADQSETWTFDRAIAGSSYGLRVTVSRRQLTGLPELVAAASELAGGQVAEQGTKPSGLLWVQKRTLGPVQEFWAGLPAGALGRIAVCTAPPEYAELARRVCLSLRAIELP